MIVMRLSARRAGNQGSVSRLRRKTSAATPAVRTQHTMAIAFA